MTTTKAPLARSDDATRVKDMPPMVVTTVDIPAGEHVVPESSRQHQARVDRWIALAVAGVLAAALGAIAYVVVQPVPDTNTHMGLSATAWSEYRAGERNIPTTGVGTADWQDYRSGERAVTVPVGPGSVDWQDYRSGERA